MVATPATAGIDLFWARLNPYQITLIGERATVKLLLRNSFERPARFQVRLQVPDGLSASPPQHIQLQADEQTQLSFELTSTPDDRRRVLLAYIDVDGQPQGPVAEALITQERE